QEDPLNAPGGTPRFLSPEQASGRVEAIGPATDVFGLGGVLYFLLTGQPLYQGESREEIYARAVAAAYDIRALERPGIPRRLRRAKGGYQALHEAGPAREGDEVQVRFRGPAGTHVGLFAVNGKGELKAVRTWPAEEVAHQAVFPGPSRTSALVGPAGTELLFV